MNKSAKLHRARSWFGANTNSSLFRDNRYIRALNWVLRIELAAIDIYNSLAKRQWWIELSPIHKNNHQIASKNLINLIIKNRGLPQQQVSLTGDIIALFVEMSFLLPAKVRGLPVRYGCMLLEKLVMRRFHLAMGLASDEDCQGLRQLYRMVELNFERLKKIY